MYGSSFRMETRRPRALRMRPTLAAVMPLPREEVTPPVTKTYFAMDLVLRGFFEWYRKTPDASNPGVPRPVGRPVEPMAPGEGAGASPSHGSPADSSGRGRSAPLDGGCRSPAPVRPT